MPRSDIIYHMLPRTHWEALVDDEPYVCASLESEGFIHCTGEADLLPFVANLHYRQEPGDWVIFSVDTRRLNAKLLWEPVGEVEFPHVYGAIDADSIVAVTTFPRTGAGEFMPPVFESEPVGGHAI